MSTIKLSLNDIYDVKKCINAMLQKNHDGLSEIQRVQNNLDWQVKAKSDISDRLSDLKTRMNRQDDKFESLIRIVEEVASTFENEDNGLSRDVKNIIYTLNSFKFSAMAAPSSAPRMSGNSLYTSGQISELNNTFGVDNTTSVNLNMFR